MSLAYCLLNRLKDMRHRLLRNGSLLLILLAIGGTFSACPAAGPQSAGGGASLGDFARSEGGGTGASANSSGVIAPLADGERMPQDTCAYQVLYGENYETTLQSVEVELPVLWTGAEGKLTWPFRVDVLLKVGDTASDYETSASTEALLHGPQVRLVYVPNGGDPAVDSRYVDTVTNLLIADGLPNAGFSDVPLGASGQIQVYIHDKRDASGHLKSADFSSVLTPFASASARDAFLSNPDMLLIGPLKIFAPETLYTEPKGPGVIRIIRPGTPLTDDVLNNMKTRRNGITIDSPPVR